MSLEWNDTKKMKTKNGKQLLVGFNLSRVFVTLYSPSFLSPFFIHNFPYNFSLSLARINEN